MKTVLCALTTAALLVTSSLALADVRTPRHGRCDSNHKLSVDKKSCVDDMTAAKYRHHKEKNTH